MPHFESGEDKLIRLLEEVIARLRGDIASLEIAVAALGVFRQPIPDFDSSRSKFALPENKFVLPRR